MQSKRRFKLTAVCIQCGYKVTKEIESDLANLFEAKDHFAKEVGTIHKLHPEPANFEVNDKLL